MTLRSSLALGLAVVACSAAPATPRPAQPSHAVAAPPEAPRAPDGVADLEVLARRKDPAAVETCIEALRDSEPRQAAAAIALAEIGRPLAEPARPALLRALEQAGPVARPQLAWTLVALGEPRALEEAVALLRSGRLSRIVRLDRKPAFQPGPFVELAKAVPLDDGARERYLDALRAGAGTAGLMLELAAIPMGDAKLVWYRTKNVFDLIALSNDPRGGDALAAYIDTKPHVHFETRAALALAAIGDLRALPALARRLRMDPLKVYSDANDWEMMLKRDDHERVSSARSIADLATLHPEQRALIRAQTEEAVLFWLKNGPWVHANAMRALSIMGSTKIVPELRTWANPKKLPKEGQQPPMPEEWVIAQSALRYVGVLKDDKSWQLLQRTLSLRPKTIDVTMDGLMKGGLAILGMSLRAAGNGGADGFAEWGDPRAFRPLLDYIDDPLNNEHSRTQACLALPWVAQKPDFAEIAKRALGYSKGDKADEFRRSCLLGALAVRPGTSVARELLPLLAPSAHLETRSEAARAVAKSGIDPALEAQLFELMKDDASMNTAALALMLGGSPETAARAVGSYARKPKADRDELAELWDRSFGLWTDEDLTSGVIFRYGDNADAIAEVTIDDRPQVFARVTLMKQFDTLVYDNGPHSLTRDVLRHRLLRLARGGDPAQSAGAIRTLELMKEAGTLLALNDERGTTGELAHAALLDVLSEATTSPQSR